MRALFLFVTLAFFLGISTSLAQEKHTHKASRVIEFPDIPGYKTLKADLHIHSVFSDGSVWPSIRVQEALRDGLDAISLTEHLEYQPHSDDIPHPDRNRAYNLALAEAKDHDLLIINGAEITREMPPGHSNAIFINDANKLLQKNSLDAFKKAKEQQAFVFWNHPNWVAQKLDGIAELSEMHQKLIKDGMLHGIEIVNEQTYSEEAFQIALDHNLTLIGTSDIHGLIDWEFDVPNGGHRPITLVFAKEKTVASLHDGLKNRKTVVWFNNTLIGTSEFLKPLIKASLEVTKTGTVSSYKGASSVQTIKIKNTSDVDYIFQNTSDYTFHRHSDVLTLKAHSTITLEVKTLKKLDEFDLKFNVLNAIVAPKTYANIEFTIKSN